MLMFANGCSMTMGAELAEPDKSAFPAIVAKHFGCELLNLAHGGSSNCRILRTSLVWIAEYLRDGGKPEDLFVLIGWTAPDRREFGLSEEEGTADPNLFWRNIHIHHQLADATPDLIQLRKLIVRSFWCDRESMTRFLVAANSLQGVLKSHGIDYCFVHAMPICNVHPELSALAGVIDTSRFFSFLEPQSDFLSRSRDPWRVPIGPLKHPLPLRQTSCRLPIHADDPRTGDTTCKEIDIHWSSENRH
jgi:Family of unknown function (DUF6071)